MTGGTHDVATLAAMPDAQMARELDSIYSRTSYDRNQQNTDTQRFFNAIGWADRTPDIMDERSYEAARRQQRAKSWYHADDPSPGVPDAATHSKQYQGAGKQYLSGGIHGDGTYWADSAGSSWGYASSPKGAQIKGFFNSRARVVEEHALRSQIQRWSRSHPQAYRRIMRSSNAYSNGLDGHLSVFAAMFGYNVINYKAAGYRTVLDRSATTVSRTIKHRQDVDTWRDW